MNIAYILVNNEEDKIQKQEKIRNYCISKNIKLDKIIIDEKDSERIGRNHIFELFLNRIKKIDNLVLLDIDSVGDGLGEQLVFFSRFKESNKKSEHLLHIFELSINIKFDDIVFNLHKNINDNFTLQLLAVLRDCELNKNKETK